MKKHVRIFVLPFDAEDRMSEDLTWRIHDAAFAVGIPPETLMAQFNVATTCGVDVNGRLHLVYTVEFFVEPVPSAKKAAV